MTTKDSLPYDFVVVFSVKVIPLFSLLYTATCLCDLRFLLPVRYLLCASYYRYRIYCVFLITGTIFIVCFLLPVQYLLCCYGFVNIICRHPN